MKKTLTGDTRLIDRAEWCDLAEIQGNDILVLKSPTMERAQRNVIEQHVVRHKLAYLGLCSSIRPYSKSRKWRVVLDRFRDLADFIITSNGGVIPIEFESSFPYMSYDAHGERRYDAIYVNVLTRRLVDFFKVHRYESLLFHYRIGLRNRAAAMRAGAELQDGGYIQRFTILPLPEHLLAARAAGWPNTGDKMHPEIAPAMLQPALDYARQYGGV